MHVTVMGIDGGMTRLGIAVVAREGEDLKLRAAGLIAHPQELPAFNAHLNAGIHQLVEQFPRALGIYEPDYIASETIPAGRLGANSELVVAAVTSCKVIAYQFGIPWYDIAANTVKKQVTGSGKATKTQVRKVVFSTFPELELKHQHEKKLQKEAGERADGLPFDVTDAVAMALAGIIKYGDTNLLEVREPEANQAVLAEARPTTR
jgi:Holliday junction resolvasome RuvABC endonuclease subunit